MAKVKVREVTIHEEKGTFLLFSGKKEEYDFDGLESLKKLLSKEKAKILDYVKYKKPGSIYNLAKGLGRPFKAVHDDVKILERFGFIDLVKEIVSGRTRRRPEIIVEEVIIHLKI